MAEVSLGKWSEIEDRRNSSQELAAKRTREIGNRGECGVQRRNNSMFVCVRILSRTCE